MVDYVLKIDIDETDLVRKLKSAMKKAGSLGMGGGGGAAGARGPAGTAGSTFPKEMPPMSMANMQKLAYIMESTKVKVAGFKEKTQFEFVKAQQKQVQRHSDSMERLGKLQNRSLSKMFTMGSIVKLAGLATGIAGLIQMRKMIIESSPMLQAMLKLLNVGIMFILRPIGDMFGFILRPLMIPFMKFAVSWYASSLKMIPVWTNMGNSILAALQGEWSDAANYWNLAKAQMAEMSTIGKMQLNAMQESSEGGVEITAGEQENIDVMKKLMTTLTTEIKSFINTGDTWDKNQSKVSDIIGAFILAQNQNIQKENRENTPAIGGDESAFGMLYNWLTGNSKDEDRRYSDLTEAQIRSQLATDSNTLKTDSNTAAIIALTGKFGAISIDGEDFYPATSKPIEGDDYWKVGDVISKEIIDQMKQIQSSTSVAGYEVPLTGGSVSSADTYKMTDRQEELMELGRQNAEIWARVAEYQKTVAGTMEEKMTLEVARAEYKMQEIYGVSGNGDPYSDTAKTGGFAIDREELASLQILIEKAEDEYKLIDDGTTEQRKAANALRELKLLAHRQIVAINEETGELADLRNQNHQDLIALSNVLSGGAGVVSGSTGGGGGGSGGGTLTPIQQYKLTQTGSYDCNGTTVTPSTTTSSTITSETEGATQAKCGLWYAGGGVINEEIYGIGKCSGKRYRFGESGDEAIIPINDFNTMVGGLSRIGIQSQIAGVTQRASAVGKFSGISGGRYARYNRNVYNAQQAVGGAQGELDEYNSNEYEGERRERYNAGQYINRYGRSQTAWGYRNTSGYSKWLGGQSALQGTLTAAQGELTGSQDKLSPYAGTFSESETIKQLAGAGTDIESSTIATNLGGITLNITGVENTEDIVNSLGPAILKYLQDNEARVGIR